MGVLTGLPWGVKFGILFVPFVVFIFSFAPSTKWKIMFSFAGAVGIAVALMGKTLPGATPLGRKF